MIEIGRLCKKIAGRDAGLTCVVVDVDKDGYATIDGETRRRKCNPRHLVALNQKADISKGASHEKVLAALHELGIEGRNTKPKQSKDSLVSVVKPTKAKKPEAKEKAAAKAKKGTVKDA